MAQCYIKLFFDWPDITQALTPEEKGRLIDSAIAYAQGENMPLTGNERFVFPVLRSRIDREREKYASIVQRNQTNGQKGGRPPKNPPEPSETDTNPEYPIGLFGNPTEPRKAKIEDRRKKIEDILPPKSPTGGAQASSFFDLFWTAYPRKVSKQNAFKAWNKLDPDEALTQKIVQAVECFKRDPSWLQDNGRYIPYPATFLNGRRWEDEAVSVAPVPIDRNDVADLSTLYT